MCGIVGIWHLDTKPIDTHELDRFTDSLSHRGPDGRGTYLSEDGCLGLGHRRLAVLDTSHSGQQPISFANDRFWLTYNGEVYNFIELRKTLESLGHIFKTETDSEVLLRAYVEWGEDFLYQLNGMWAFAIWDQDRKILFIARDRFGVKPLHYFFNGRIFAFASELKAFMALDPSYRPDFDHEMVALMSNLESVERSLLTNVKILGPGEKMVVNGDGVLRKTSWWDTQNHLFEAPMSYLDQIDQFRSVFLDCCRLRLRSDVRVATALSGGLDSSAVIAGLHTAVKTSPRSRIPEDWQSAYIFDYVNTRHSERDYGEAMANAVGANKRIIEGNEQLVNLNNIIDCTYSLETIKNKEPLIGPWLLYKAMRSDGVSVSIDGHGGDELLGGYVHHVKAALGSALFPYPNVQRYRDVVEIYQGLLSGDTPERVYRESITIPRTLLGLLPTRKQLNESSIAKINFVGDAFFGDHWASLKEKYLSSKDDSFLLGKKGNPVYRKRGLDGLNSLNMGVLGRTLYNDFHGGTLPKILRNFDRASMAHGIEIRAPMLDWRLVTLAFSLPDDAKIGGGYTKRILRDAFTPELPDVIRTRKSKLGFSSPIENWYKTILKEFILDEINSRSFLESEVWNGPKIREFVVNCYATAQYREATKSWKYIQASILMKEFKSRSP
jgi:asparagine synthase (glutamine-hydrolysing)